MTDTLIASVQAGFEAKYGYAPAGVWSAPGRVNLIGEHTDYNEGFVFPFAINRHTFAAIALRSDSVARVSSSFSDVVHEADVTAIARDAAHDWAAYPFGAAWAIQEMANSLLKEFDATGFDCYIESDVPVGAGLSSSAAIECSVALALNELWSVGLDRRQLARVGQHDCRRTHRHHGSICFASWRDRPRRVLRLPLTRGAIHRTRFRSRGA
jgi:galactokinase